MTFPTYSMRQLLEAGVHFGHTTRRWNPKMAPYIFGVRNGIHIIDLEQTVPLLHQSLLVVRDIVAGGGRVLFVGTKRQASEKIAEAAKRCGQYYVNHRWLGGMLTNWKTISNSIRRLKEVEDRLAEEHSGLTKKELLNLTREREKLERALGGIREMGGLPDVIFVIDTVKEHIAINEAGNLNIPVVGILDSNSDPSGITYPVPGNDDATRAIALYCDLISDAVLDGIQQELIASGEDIGEAAETPGEKVPDEKVPDEKAPGDEEAATEAAQPSAGAEAEQPKAEEAPKPEEAPKAEETPDGAETAKAKDAPEPEKAAKEEAAEPATEAASAEQAAPAEEPQAEDAEAKAQA